MTLSAREQLERFKRGASEILSERELLAKLEKSVREHKPLRIKAGFDPSAPDLHLGHAVLLRKLKDFQDCGHHVIFLVGDFTARIGDPTGKNELRKPLTDADVKRNSETYERQVFRVLDKTKTQVVYNNDWLGRLTPQDFLRLTSRISVAQMLARADFKQRYEAGKDISIVEFLYPLLQAHDSVELKADVELGGTDQKFNLLMGRELQEYNGQAPQVILMMPILEGVGGVQKMSKSLGNSIPLQSGKDDAERSYNIFAPIMSISDALMWRYYELLTHEDVGVLKKAVESGNLHPKKCKEDLARNITAQFYGEKNAAVCGQRFEQRHGKTKTSVSASADLFDERTVSKTEIQDGKIWICKLLTLIGAAKSNGEARRLIEQGGVSLNEQKITDPSYQLVIDESKPLLATIGKHGFYKISLNNAC